MSMACSDDLTTWVMESSIYIGSKDVWKDGLISEASSLAWKTLDDKLSMSQLR